MTRPVCNIIAPDLDVRDHIVLDEYSWMMSNPTTQIGICYYTRICDALTITKDKSVDVKKPYIHYIAVKTNEQRQQEITVLTSL